MEIIIDFLAANYLWFLIITIILIFSLIGYVVDSREQKELKVFESPQEMAMNLEWLAAEAQNKTISEAVNQPNIIGLGIDMNANNNTIVDTTISNNYVNYSQTGDMKSNFDINNQQVLPNLSQQQQFSENTTSNSNTSFEILGK